MAGYIGTTPVPQATQHRESFTATGGQTSFATAGYTPQFIDVYLNGVKLAPADYTATNGSDVVLASGATASDILEIVAYTPFEVANQTFTGDTSVTNLAVTGTFTSRGIDDNADAVAITIDSSENVGIGTSSPSDDVEISTSADGKGLTIKNSGNNRPYLNFDSNRSSAGNNLAELHFKWNGTDVARIIAVAGSDTTNKDDGHITFSTSSTGSVDERMRLDSSGNLLVGKTSADFGSSIGFEANSNDTVYATRSGGASLTLNRTTSDGDIALFRKDGTTVGSIGNHGAAPAFRNVNDDGISVLTDDGLARLVSTNSAGIADDDGTLGTASYRWRDLYLSGGVYLGGTAAGNALDDYEEGTWTPILRFGSGYTSSYSEQIGTYTKIGRAVTVTYRIVIGTKGPHTGAITVNGLPFTVANTGLYPAFYGLHHNINSGSGGSVSGQLPVNQLLANQTYAGFYTSNSTGSPVVVTEAYVSNGSVLNGTVTYMST